MNLIELETVKVVSKLIDIVLEGKVENLQQAKRIKEIVDELVEFKNFSGE